MAVTRAFKSGNSQAIRIPADLAYADCGSDLTITRSGDVITIYPARQSLRDAVATLRGMASPSEIEVRDPIDVPIRADD